MTRLLACLIVCVALPVLAERPLSSDPLAAIDMHRSAIVGDIVRAFTPRFLQSGAFRSFPGGWRPNLAPLRPPLQRPDPGGVGPWH